MIAYFIIGCEIAFWVFVAAGLSVRYLLGMKRLGMTLLMATPIIDLLLLVATVMDLQRGATASMVHGIAAIYIGVSIAYGHQMIAWADRYFLFWFKGGESPRSRKAYGREHASKERSGWFRHLAAYIIGTAFLLGMTWWIGDANRTEAFINIVRVWGIVLVIDFVISFSYSLWPRKVPAKKVK
ncbi:2TM domain-containing protein [Paenibacillus xylanilyticus]|uniref:2TM domain-containing protein n=1 Tax=Paenibacillus xylanilyticus TaxID=248903 RepID=UPI0039A0E333